MRKERRRWRPGAAAAAAPRSRATSGPRGRVVGSGAGGGAGEGRYLARSWIRCPGLKPETKEHCKPGLLWVFSSSECYSQFIQSL
uniref:Uncharacterized protein n=1 Tax=Oryza sativa subsp. japonica TaxID=39947 RepID=Q6K375_ORYSJ|nr:hypothetical protein [Oryza sativa Japonica Group]BAD22443.1 hypothetical protein [Oryza sativa Japonica Group]